MFCSISLLLGKLVEGVVTEWSLLVFNAICTFPYMVKSTCLASCHLSHKNIGLGECLQLGVEDQVSASVEDTVGWWSARAALAHLSAVSWWSARAMLAHPSTVSWWSMRAALAYPSTEAQHVDSSVEAE